MSTNFPQPSPDDVKRNKVHFLDLVFTIFIHSYYTAFQKKKTVECAYCSIPMESVPGYSENSGMGVQCAKKVVSDSPGLVDFAIGLVNCVINLPHGQVKYFGEFKLQKNCEIHLLIKTFLGLVEMMFGLLNVSFSLPEWQALKMIFFAPWQGSLSTCSSIAPLQRTLFTVRTDPKKSRGKLLGSFKAIKVIEKWYGPTLLWVFVL